MTCCDKLWIKNAWKVSYFCFVFHYILFSGTLQHWEASKHTTLWKIWLKFFPLLAICLHAKNQCDPVIPSGDICDQRILQSNWLKAFPGITQETQKWDLYSIIDNNTNFYFKYISSKNQCQNFQNKRKTLFWGHSWTYCFFCPKGIFPKKSG